jgi:riboflavin synthase
MFTGLVEETGIVKRFEKGSVGAVLIVECSKILEDLILGDSVAVNGVCQTVVAKDENTFTVQVSDETLRVTNFETFKHGTIVNLERALALNSRLGGHFVSGHVDCCGKLVSKTKKNEFYDIEFLLPIDFSKYIVKKGSVTINGISLTVANVRDERFSVSVIPHTYENTNLSELNFGDSVNIETDILGKYVEKFLSVKDNKSNIDMKFLQENGFV